MSIEELYGKIISKIERFNTNDGDEIHFYLSNGAIYRQYHSQSCCESVYIEDIEGDLDDLIDLPLLQAEESTSDASATDVDSATWTFYKLATVKGYVTIRWYGSSNGYYSETADIEKIRDEDPIKEIRKKKLKKITNKNSFFL